jgi:hypothetical protein
VFFILHTAFFGLHYLFASQTAHIGALYAAFLAMMLAAGMGEHMCALWGSGGGGCTKVLDVDSSRSRFPHMPALCTIISRRPACAESACLP